MWDLSNKLIMLVSYGCLALQLWAFVDCATRRQDAFVAADKLTKPAWMVITGIAAAITFFFGLLSFFGIAAMIAAIFYLVDVRPAVREVQSGGGRW